MGRGGGGAGGKGPAHCPTTNNYSLHWWCRVCDAGRAFIQKRA